MFIFECSWRIASGQEAHCWVMSALHEMNSNFYCNAVNVIVVVERKKLITTRSLCWHYHLDHFWLFVFEDYRKSDNDPKKFSLFKRSRKNLSQRSKQPENKKKPIEVKTIKSREGEKEATECGQSVQCACTSHYQDQCDSIIRLSLIGWRVELI